MQAQETSKVTAATEDDRNETHDEDDMQDNEGENNNLGEYGEEKDSEVDDVEEDGEDEEEEEVQSEELVEELTNPIKVFNFAYTVGYDAKLDLYRRSFRTCSTLPLRSKGLLPPSTRGVQLLSLLSTLTALVQLGSLSASLRLSAFVKQ